MTKEEYDAVVLLSGGLDSALLLAEAVKAYGKEKVIALFLNYDQEHRGAEFQAAVAIAGHYEIDFRVHDCPGLPEPVDKSTTLIPGRNAVFLSLTCALAEYWGVKRVFIGANKDDFDDYLDCRPIWFELYNNLLRGTNMKVRVKAPLVFLTKEKIVERAYKIGLPVDKTWSCYRGNHDPCGECAACKLRDSAIKAAKKSTMDGQ